MYVSKEIYKHVCVYIFDYYIYINHQKYMSPSILHVTGVPFYLIYCFPTIDKLCLSNTFYLPNIYKSCS